MSRHRIRTPKYRSELARFRGSFGTTGPTIHVESRAEINAQLERRLCPRVRRTPGAGKDGAAQTSPSRRLAHERQPLTHLIHRLCAAGQRLVAGLREVRS